MKNLLTISLLLLSTLVFCKTPPTRSIIFIKQENKKINLHLPKGVKNYETNWKANGACLLVAGLAFTTASILEGGSQYGTYKPVPNSYTQTYYQPPFYQQQPRFTMFLVGVGLSLGGFGLMIN